MRMLVPIPGGRVTLRDARRNSERTVELLPFSISQTPITTSDYAAGHFEQQLAGLPASGVRWIDAVLWCNAASLADGLAPAYETAGPAIRWKTAADGYRLPTEAEWVYASLASGTGPRHGTLAEIAWSAADKVTGPQPVATKEPNEFGLFDTLGNVWEWCWDRLDPARYGDYRVLKGGGWADPEWNCRVGVRRGTAPDAAIEDVGFRVARGAVSNAIDEDGGQGWSEASDRQRAMLTAPLPVGWTPLRLE